MYTGTPFYPVRTRRSEPFPRDQCIADLTIDTNVGKEQLINQTEWLKWMFKEQAPTDSMWHSLLTENPNSSRNFPALLDLGRDVVLLVRRRVVLSKFTNLKNKFVSTSIKLGTFHNHQSADEKKSKFIKFL